jgi:hypothetical protein
MPELRNFPFEAAIIERYRRRETSVEEALVEMYLAGVSTRRIEDIPNDLLGLGALPGDHVLRQVQHHAENRTAKPSLRLPHNRDPSPRPVNGYLLVKDVMRRARTKQRRYADSRRLP